MVNREDLTTLHRFLKGRFNEEEAFNLSKLLYQSCFADMVTYNEINMDTVCRDDILLIACEKRLLLPIKSLPGSAWESRILTFDNQEKYQMPRIVKFLVHNVLINGIWDYDRAIEQSLKEAGENNVREMKVFLYRLRDVSTGNQLDINLMQAVKNELAIDIDMHDALDRFVRCGIMSPLTQRSLYSGSAKYEIHPCLFWA